MTKIRILIVDDDPDIRYVISSVLTLHDYSVTEADNGHEGLLKILETSPHLVLSDNNMPIMTGIELYKTIRNEASLNHIPVIIMTGEKIPNLLKELENCDPPEIIQKPFSISQMLIAIQRQFSI